LTIKALFTDDFYLDYDSDGVIRLYPIQFIGKLLGFVFTSPGFQLVKTLAAQRWKTEK